MQFSGNPKKWSSKFPQKLVPLKWLVQSQASGLGDKDYLEAP